MSRPGFDIFVVPAAQFHLSRPDYLATLGDGCFIVLSEPAEAQENEAGARPRGWNADIGRESGAWLHFASDGAITAFTGKVEVGQDIRTSLSQIVAEELRVAPQAITVVMGDTALVPFDMGTFGSRTTPFTVPQFRAVAAAAREWLLGSAAVQSGTARQGWRVEQGQILHAATGRRFCFGELSGETKNAARLNMEVAPRSPAEWDTAGKSAPKIGARAMVTGAHRYTSDLKRTGMLWAKVLRAPAFGAELLSLDDRAALAIEGVWVVREGEFVGVAAPNPFDAERALAALSATWSQPVHAQGSENHAFARNNSDDVQGARNPEPFVQGEVCAAFGAADVSLEASYSIAFIAHAPLEPRAALAEWDLGGPQELLTVWTGTQRPFGVRDELAEALQLSASQVRVIVPDTGSGYGGKHTGEAALEAARLARVARRPVKLVWTREEEFTWAYSRPGGLIEAKIGARRDGVVTSWECHNINSGSSGLATPYDIAHQHLQFHVAASPLRQGSYRALASTANHFARECLMDEMAHHLGFDPLQFRLKNLSHPRMRAVLEAAAARFGWTQTPLPGHGFGLAVGTEKAGYVATCAEVKMHDGHIQIVRLTTAFECGAIINPAHLKSQIEGALVQGLGGALFEAVKWQQGRVETDNFSSYRVPRFSDLPRLDTLLLDRPDLKSEGAGESPLIAVAPAIGNALFCATGERRRSMPLG